MSAVRDIRRQNQSPWEQESKYQTNNGTYKIKDSV